MEQVKFQVEEQNLKRHKIPTSLFQTVGSLIGVIYFALSHSPFTFNTINMDPNQPSYTVFSILTGMFPLASEQDLKEAAQTFPDSAGAAADWLLSCEQPTSRNFNYLPPDESAQQIQHGSSLSNSLQASQDAKINLMQQTLRDIAIPILRGALRANNGQVIEAIHQLLDIRDSPEALEQLAALDNEGKEQVRKMTFSLEQKTEKLNSVQDSLLHEIGGLKNSLDVLDRRLMSAKSNQQDTRELQQHMQKAMNEIASVQQSLDSAAAKNANLEAEVARLQQLSNDEKEQLQGALQQKQRELEEAVNIRRQMEQNLNQLIEEEKQKRQLPSTYDHSKTIIQLKADKETMDREAERARHAVAQLQSQYANMQRRQEENETALDALKKELAKPCTVEASYLGKTNSILIQWKLSAMVTATPNDMIAIHKEGTDSSQPVHTVPTSGLSSWVVETKFKYESNGFYVASYIHGEQGVLATSEHFHIGSALHMIATLDEKLEKVTLNYRVLYGCVTSKDWIGFFRTDSPYPLDFRYVDPNLIESEWTAMIPVASGGFGFEFKYFSGLAPSRPASASVTVSIPKLDKISVESKHPEPGRTDQIVDTIRWYLVLAPPHRSDWIEMVDAKTNLRVGSNWRYIDLTKGMLEFTVPRPPMDYYYRYWSSYLNSAPIAISQTLNVPKRDKIQQDLSKASATIEARWEIHSVDVTRLCYIALINSATLKTEFREYIPTSANIVFFPANPGSWSLAFFDGKNHKVVETDPFVVN